MHYVELVVAMLAGCLVGLILIRLGVESIRGDLSDVRRLLREVAGVERMLAGQLIEDLSDIRRLLREVAEGRRGETEVGSGHSCESGNLSSRGMTGE